MKRDAGKIKLMSMNDIFSTEEDRAGADMERVKEISLSDLHPFRNHPFKVLDDVSMQDLVESVKEHGVLSPAIVRSLPSGGYEIISGHRRRRASELAGKDTMPVIVRDLGDDDAILLMVDSNLQRTELLPSEKAFSYKMKLEAIKHQGARIDLSSEGISGRSSWAVERVAEDAGESSSQIQRFIRLTLLVPKLLDMVDAKKIPVGAAYELSFLKSSTQESLNNAIADTGKTPSLSQARRMKQQELMDAGNLSYSKICDILLEKKVSGSVKIVLSSSVLAKYFPQNCSEKEIEEILISLLDRWKNEGEES